MSDLPPPAPVAPVPKTARLDPPPDVQASVAAALHACHAWQPVIVPAPTPGSVLSGAPVTAGTVEAGVCNLIDDWPHAAEAHEMFGLSVGVVLGLVAAVLVLMLRRGLRAFWYTRAGWWMRETLGEPWRDIQAAGLGASGGVLVAVLLTSGLARAGLGGPSVPGVLLFIAGAAGAVCGLRMRHSQQRRNGVGGLW